MAQWSNNEDSSSDEEAQKVANLCLMAHQEEVNVEISLDFTFDKLQETFIDLLIEFNEERLTKKELKK